MSQKSPLYAKVEQRCCGKIGQNALTGTLASLNSCHGHKLG